MNKFRALTVATVLPLMALGIAWALLSGMPVQAAPPNLPHYQAPGDCVVTSTADGGPGSLRACILGLEPGATITFSTSIFPPTSPATISITGALPTIITNNVTIDGSDAGVILDGSQIGTTPETLLLDDVSLGLDGGPNLLTNGDFSAGLGHWRPWDQRAGATRDLNTSDFQSPPHSYQSTTVAPAGETRTVYDTTNTSDPFDDRPYDEESSVWISATGGSTAELRFWYRYGGLGAKLRTLFSDGHEEALDPLWFDWEAGWREIVMTRTLPADAVGISIEFNHLHSQAGSTGLVIDGASNVVVKGLQILNFPWIGVELRNGAQHNVIGGSNATPGGNCSGECNLISGNGNSGVEITSSGTMSNTISGNYIGTDVSGIAALRNDDNGVEINDGASYNLIGGDTPGERNLLSGNGDGLDIRNSGTMGNTVSGNYIGTDVDGISAIPNDTDGVTISRGASFNVVGGNNVSPGGACSGDCNLIGGNGLHGVHIYGSGTMSNTVSGNYIGTNADGTAAIGNADSGVWINGAQYNTVGGDTAAKRNLISGNSGSGVNIAGSGAMSNTVSGNYIGVDVSGMITLANSREGVAITNGASFNAIGGDSEGERNVLSGNQQEGILIYGSGTVNNTISGNYIGTNASGTAAIGNDGDGIDIHQAGYNLIGGDNATPGGSCTGECNLISGNGGNGVFISDTGANGNTVSGNYIGTGIFGSAPLGNGRVGVVIYNNAKFNRVGGSTPGEGNIIASNNLGVAVAQSADHNTIKGNYIGTNATGTVDLGNTAHGVNFDGANNNVAEDNIIAYTKPHPDAVGSGVVVRRDGINNTLRRNLIYSNTDKGILLADGGNLELFPPILTDVGVNYVSGKAPPGSRIEIFSDAEDEGRYYHGSTVADASGDFTFSQPGAFTGANVTATATATDGNTSEFSSAYTPLVDVQVVAVVQPKSGGKINQVVTPTVKIGNAGTTAETGISVSVAATGSALSADYSDSQAGLSLPPLGYTTLSFQPFTPITVGSYDLTASVTLAGDQDPSNDTKGQAVAVASDVIDLWTRDYLADVGDIPAYLFWQSPDLWVRNADDGGTKHQDPIANQVNWVYMIVRNRGDVASDGADAARVYWHEPSLGIKCGDWALIDQQPIASVPASSGHQLVKFSWTPTRAGHTCLHGEILSDDDPVANPCDIPWDNNLSQRNVEIVAGGEGLSAQASGGIVFEVTNIKKAPKPVALILDVSDVPVPNAVRLDLGDDLAARWASVDGLAQSSGVAWTGGSMVTVTHPSSATLAGIPMAGGETQTVTLLVDAPSVETTTVSIYEAIDAGPGVPLADAVVGGNTYIFSTDASAVYLPIVLKE